jgi:sporulation protein YlmC with PRC-barrel domain
MNRYLASTALGLVLGLAPALAQEQPPADATQAPPAASQLPAQPPQAMPSVPSESSDPGAPIPGGTSEAPQPTPALPPAAEAPQPSEPTFAPAAEAPQPFEPAAPKSAEAPSSGAQFLSKQESTDYLASSLIGQSVYNAQDEVIGDVNDLVADQGGKVVALLIGAGGFLGIGEKDVALRFEDLKFTRDENNNIKLIANFNKDALASAPDYETLSEQAVTIGAGGETGGGASQQQ